MELADILFCNFSQEHHSPVSPKKGKKSKHPKPPKDHRNSPLLSRQIIAAAAAAKKLDSTEAPEFQSPVNVEPSSPLRIKRRNWATKELLTRSCSVDGLDDLAGEKESKRKSHHAPEFNIRRCSTEVNEESRTSASVAERGEAFPPSFP